jgi:hypothetical protein
VEEGPSLGLYREEGRENGRPFYLQEGFKSIALFAFFFFIKCKAKPQSLDYLKPT